MSCNGKLPEQRRARELRAQSWTLQDIAVELRVAKSSVSLWVRDVDFVPKPRNRGHRSMKPHPLHAAKLEEIERCRKEGAELIGTMSEREFLILGVALYLGEGAKTGTSVKFANSDPRLIWLFVTWLRRYFEVDERRLRLRLYLHAHHDLDAATRFWSELTGIPPSQFGTPYRAVVDPTIRKSRHVMGCPSVIYSSTAVLRRVTGLMEAVTCPTAIPG